jgi:hypothetical protein
MRRQAQRGGGGKGAAYRNPAVGGGTQLTPCPGRFSPGKDPVSTVSSRSNRTPSSGRSGRNESLYRLSYRGRLSISTSNNLTEYLELTAGIAHRVPLVASLNTAALPKRPGDCRLSVR